MRNGLHGYCCLHRIALPLLMLVGCCGVAGACNVPVFRYALEHWHAAPYRLTLLHRGALDETAQAHAAQLQRHPAAASAFGLRTLDIATAEAEADHALIAAVKETSLPALVLQYPEQFGLDKPFLTIPCDADAPSKVIDSPLRSELVRRLIGGDTAVWLVLQSGDRQADDAAIALLSEELKRLEVQLKLPDPALGEVTSEAFQGPPLQIKFSILPVARAGVDETLVAALLHCESDLMERADPLIFPVFGRGRALFPLIGAGITAQNIANYGEFLVGACSCQVKEQNPGFDLLLTTDWSSVLRDAGMQEVALALPRSPTPTTPELVLIPRGAAASNAESSTPISTPVAASPMAPSPKVTQASPGSASAPALSAMFSSASGAAPWMLGVGAIGLIVVAIAMWRRASATRPHA